jgi:O-succinylbenzoate synthase
VKIEKIELHHIAIKLLYPFKTSFSTQLEQPCVLVSVHSGGLVGWGECVVGLGPFYSSESIMSAWMILKDYLVPMVLGNELAQPSDVVALTKRVRGNEMAKAGLENAVWDLFAKARGMPLKTMLGGVRDRVAVGVSIGIQPTVDALLAVVGGFVEKGYGRIKLKIQRGFEVEPLSAVRAHFPDTLLMADANSDYTLADMELLKRLDPLKLLMIEQPLSDDDIIDHAKLQAVMDTPICLDESIHRPDDVRHAIELKACRIINVKVGRVGGLTNALKIHAMTQEAGIPLWSGGMLETGIGRATNLALASLPNFRLPNDISATDRYFKEDITRPFVLNKADSTITVPTGAGIGVEVDQDRLAGYRLQHWATKA